MYKILALLKRRPGMSMKEFVDYYESTHSKIGEKYLRGIAVKYIRRYLQPLSHPLTGEGAEPEYDAVMEMWFKDREGWNSAMAVFTAPDVASLVVNDEKQLFDRARIQMFTVEERESELG